MNNSTHAKVIRVLAFVHLVILVAAIIFTKTVNTNLGIRNMNDLDNADLMLKIIYQSPIILFYPSVDIFMGLTLIGIVIAFQNIYSKSDYLGKLQTVFGLSAGVFYIYGSFSRLLTLPHFAQVYQTNASEGRLSYNIANFVQYGNSYFINAMIGVWVIALSVLFIRDKIYNRYVCYFFIALALVSFFIVAYKVLFPVLFPLLILWYLALVFFNKKTFRK